MKGHERFDIACTVFVWGGSPNSPQKPGSIFSHDAMSFALAKMNASKEKIH